MVHISLLHGFLHPSLQDFFHQPYHHSTSDETYTTNKQIHLHQTSSQMQWRQWAEWNQTRWPRRAAWFKAAFFFVHPRVATTEGSEFNIRGPWTKAQSEDTSRLQLLFVVDPLQRKPVILWSIPVSFCTFAPGTKNCLLWVQYFHTPTTKKNEFAIEKSCWQDHPFFWRKPFRWVFCLAKNLSKSWWVNLFQSISNRLQSDWNFQE